MRSYVPAEIEPRIYEEWLRGNHFAPVGERGELEKGSKYFCIVVPPPNVTGSLHLGHAWDSTLQDILVRWMRMDGCPTLWLPGTDHAGIATQWMVESQLQEEGCSKEQLGREAFLKRVWQFKETSQQNITNQLKQLGVSCDWGRERFTLDETLSRAVRCAFVKLYQAGLIYRGLRMVNWSPRLRSAVSDLEVEHRDVQGSMYHLLYPFEDGPLPDGRQGVVIATTRPETMLADGAVAFNPADERYAGLEEKNLILPIIKRKLPLIKDEQVKQDFGTGAVKISVGHDFNDFEIGKRHNIPVYEVMDKKGCMCGDIPQRYQGLDRYVARKKIVAELKEQGVLVKIEPHEHSVGYCGRSGEPVEPCVSTQWFVSTKDMAIQALEVVNSRRVRLIPQFQEKIFAEWMDNIQEWCISRQLWWGHRIPAWYCEDCKGVTVAEDIPNCCQHCQSKQIEQDRDVLDTWFSSSLWPFSVMGWPEETSDLKTFFPTTVLVTGYDILFFWVARMIMMSLQLLETIPFDEVLLHGLLRDEKGIKMSKTKGNGLDPLKLINIHGADALRMALAAGTNLGHDMSLAESSCEAMRNFVNKLWNASRFVLGHKERLGEPPALMSALTSDVSALPEFPLFEAWIFSRLQQVTVETRQFLEARRFNEAAKLLYNFVWREYCDWYLESVKPTLLSDKEVFRQAGWAVSHQVLVEVLKLLHPFIPFVTEHLWGILQPQAKPLIMCTYPQGMELAKQPDSLRRTAKEADRLIAVIREVRTVRSESVVPPQARIPVQISSADEDICQLLERHKALFMNLAKLSSVGFGGQDTKNWVRGVGDGFEVALCLEGVMDTAKELQRLEKEKIKLYAELQQVRIKLENKLFMSKAPPLVVKKNRERNDSLKTQLSKLDRSLRRLST